MYLSIGALIATLAIHGFVGIFALFLGIRKTPGAPYLSIAGAAFALQFACVTRLGEFDYVGHTELVAALALALRWVSTYLSFAGAALVFALAIQVVCLYADLARARYWIVVGYVAAFAAIGADAVLRVLHLRLSVVKQSMAGLDLSLLPPETGPLASPLLAAGGLSLILCCVLLLRRYRAGKTELLGCLVGVALFLLAITHDLVRFTGIHVGSSLGHLGGLAFTTGIVISFFTRHTTLSRQLDQRTQELSHRTRELNRSYDALRAAKEELVTKEQLAAVGELAAVVAHEVRNPLAVIANAVAALRKSTLSREDHGTLLVILEEETSRLNRLVSDLLRYARPISMQRTQVSLIELVERALKVIPERKKITVNRRLVAETDLIWGDANLLRQVIDNLMENAVQAMGTEGKLMISVERRDLGGEEGVALIIADTGEGMDAAVHARARDPFFTTRPSGTGLGLAIVDRIVEAHGGQLVIDSHAGEGTIVTVTFLKEDKVIMSEPMPPGAASSMEQLAAPGSGVDPAGSATITISPGSGNGRRMA